MIYGNYFCLKLVQWLTSSKHGTRRVRGSLISAKQFWKVSSCLASDNCEWFLWWKRSAHGNCWAERLSLSLHALDSYQQSLPVNRACTVWKMVSVTCKLGTRWCCVLIGDWRKSRSETGGLDELSWFIRETVRGCNSIAIASISYSYRIRIYDDSCRP